MPTPSLPGFAPALPGVSKTDAPLSGKDLIGDLVNKMQGGQQMPRLSAGDKVAQAIQLLREAGQMDMRIAPIVNGALQSLITGPQGPNGGVGGPPVGTPPPVMGPASQMQAGPGAGVGQLAAMMAAG